MTDVETFPCWIVGDFPTGDPMNLRLVLVFHKTPKHIVDRAAVLMLHVWEGGALGYFALDTCLCPSGLVRPAGTRLDFAARSELELDMLAAALGVTVQGKGERTVPRDFTS